MIATIVVIHATAATAVIPVIAPESQGRNTTAAAIRRATADRAIAAAAIAIPVTAAIAVPVIDRAETNHGRFPRGVFAAGFADFLASISRVRFRQSRRAGFSPAFTGGIGAW